ncbi:hypothetical protein BYT27DRAFT_7223455 [Phlegmacium glaucopus]|nr:hypothetical protein BYT27DRAFT_7223455 [Phlegmacium glaucopus]
MGVQCREVEGGPRYNADCVRLAMKQVWSKGTNSDSAADLPALIISSSTDSYDAQELDSPHLPERPNRVRFRSRVRITSGLNRHRHNSQKKQQNQSEFDSFSFSPASSVSCSPSSSISVPLRTHTDEQVGRPGWGTLGQRVSLFARGNIERRKLREQRERIGLGASEVERRGYGGVEPPLIPCVGTNEVNEETPLLLSPSSRRRHMDSDSAREDDARQMSREIEIAFGSWPGRLANHHWWWWQVEPIICCYLCDSSDDEG